MKIIFWFFVGFEALRVVTTQVMLFSVGVTVQLVINIPTFRGTPLSPPPPFDTERVDNITCEFCFVGQVQRKCGWKEMSTLLLDLPSESGCTTGQYVLDFSYISSKLSYLLFRLLSVYADAIFFSQLTDAPLVVHTVRYFVQAVCAFCHRTSSIHASRISQMCLFDHILYWEAFKHDLALESFHCTSFSLSLLIHLAY